jgi:DNA-binding XRE family transcriptional regulator
MTRNFKELRAKMSPERRARIEQKTKTLRNEMALNELREAVSLTQESLADTLGVKQSSISKMERRSDMYLSTLRKIIEAMGGELDIIAMMPDGPVRITQFNQLRANKQTEVA